MTRIMSEQETDVAKKNLRSCCPGWEFPAVVVFLPGPDRERNLAAPVKEAQDLRRVEFQGLGQQREPPRVITA